MEDPARLESEAQAKELEAERLEADALTLAKANDPIWVLKRQEASGRRDLASYLRQRALIASQQRSSPPLEQWELEDAVEARAIKRARQAETTVCMIGQDLLRNSRRDDLHFHGFLAGGDEKVPDNFLSSSLGKKIKKQWEGAQGDQDIQECLDSMIPELLQQLHGCEPDKSRPTYNNASGRGFLCGRSMTIGCNICEGSRRMDAHLGTFMEATLSLRAGQREVVGQSWDRVQALQDKQPGRDTWRTAVVGKEAFQLWEFRIDKQGLCCQSRSSALVQFSLESDSVGFQLFVRWLATDLRALGFISPPIPNVLEPSGMVIDSVILGGYASQADELFKKRPVVQVYKALNLSCLQTLPGLKDHTVVLVGAAKLQLGQRVQDALIIKPYAQHIPLDMSFHQLVLYMRQYVESVGCLYKAGYLHRDLSYSNLLISEDRKRAIISDWETMGRVEEQEAAEARGLQTGTPLFAAVSTLDGAPQTLSSELETLFNVMLYTLSGGALPWRDVAKDDPHLIHVRRGVMIKGEYERIVLKSIDKECWPALQRLRAVFFPDGGSSYRTDVGCQDFLSAL